MAIKMILDFVWIFKNLVLIHVLKLTAQHLILRKSSRQSKLATEAFYVISYVLVKHKKYYSNGEVFVREAFLESSEKLFNNFKNKNKILNAIKDLQLSCRTITRRNEDMSGNVTQQLEDHIQNCSFLSLQFDE